MVENNSHSSLDKLKRRILKTTAVLTAGAGALTLAGCSTEAQSGDWTCAGSHEVTVQTGDTLGQLLLEQTRGVDSKNVRNIAIALGDQAAFRGEGNLNIFKVPTFTADAPAPTLTAGETVDLPEQCGHTNS